VPRPLDDLAARKLGDTRVPSQPPSEIAVELRAGETGRVTIGVEPPWAPRDVVRPDGVGHTYRASAHTAQHVHDPLPMAPEDVGWEAGEGEPFGRDELVRVRIRVAEDDPRREYDCRVVAAKERSRIQPDEPRRLGLDPERFSGDAHGRPGEGLPGFDLAPEQAPHLEVLALHENHAIRVDDGDVDRHTGQRIAHCAATIASGATAQPAATVTLAPVWSTLVC